MQFFLLALLSATVSIVSAQDHAYSNMTYTTEIVTAYTTYCPAATMITHGTNTYTVTEATTLTITDCPCTVSMPVYTSTVVSCSTCSSLSSTPVYPISSTPLPSRLSNSTASAFAPSGTPITPSGTAIKPVGGNSTFPPIATYTGGASSNLIGTGAAGVMGLVGLVALVL